MAIRVSNIDELMTALEGATGGEVIELEGGIYGELDIYDGKGNLFRYDEPVTIKSVDASDMAVFDSIFVKDATNIIFDAIHVDYDAAPGAHESKRITRFDDVANVTIRNSLFEGDLATGVDEDENGFPTGVAFAFSDSFDITVENNEFVRLHRAGVFGGTDGINVIGNEVHNIRSDGFNFADVSDVLIEGNYLHDFTAATETGDHRDMIQFWTTNTDDPSVNITIRGNVLDSNEGDWTQSIYIQNEEVLRGAGQEMFYRNVVIEDNVIRNAQANGIHISAADGVLIQNNTVVHNATTGSEFSVNVPKISVNETVINAQVINNVASRYTIQSEDVIFENNIEVQRTYAHEDNYYADEFVDGLSDQGDVLTDLLASPDGEIAARGAGSSLLLDYGSLPSTIGVVGFDGGEGLERSTLDFTIDALISPGGLLDLSLIDTVVWDFGDGETAEGVETTHTYDGPGRYDTTATITLTNGETATASRTVEIESNVALSLPFDGSFTDAEDPSTDVSVSGGVEFVTEGGQTAVDLNGGVVSYDTDTDFFTNAEYTLLTTFKVGDSIDEKGRILNLSGSFVVDVSANEADVSVSTDQGGIRFRVDDLNLYDGAWHQLAVRFSGVTGVIELILDGDVIAWVDGYVGARQPDGSNDLHVGNPWGDSFRGLIADVEFVRGALSDDALNVEWEADVPQPDMAPLQLGEELGDAYDDAVDPGVEADTPDGAGFGSAPGDNDQTAQDVLADVASDPVVDQDEPIADLEPTDVVEEPVFAETDPTNEGSISDEDPADEAGAAQDDPDDGSTDNEPVIHIADDVNVDVVLTNPPTISVDFTAFSVDLGDGGTVLYQGDLEIVTAGGNGVTSLGRLDQIDDATSLSVLLDVALPDTPSDEAVRLFWNHQRFGIELEDDVLHAWYMTEGGGFTRVTSEPVDLAYGSSVNLALILDEETDTVTLALDGVVVANVADASVVVADQSAWSASVGGATYGSVFDGDILALAIYQEKVDPATTAELLTSAFSEPDDVSQPAVENDIVVDILALAAVESDPVDTFVFDGIDDFARVEVVDAVADGSELRLSFDFRRDADGTDDYARLVWNAGAYGVEIDGDALSVVVFDADGAAQRFTARGVDVGESWHSLSVDMDSASGDVVARLDGEVIIQASGVDMGFAADDDPTINVGGASFGHHFDGEIANLSLEEAYDTVI